MAAHKTVKVTHPDGLRARSAALFVAAASRFQSQIIVEVGNKKINAKSIMGVLSLGVTEGEDISIHAKGADEGEAIAALETIAEGGQLE